MRRAGRGARRTSQDVEVPESPHIKVSTDLAMTARPFPPIDLLSPWVHESITVRRLRKRFGYAAAALVVLAGMAWGGQQLRLAEVEERLRGEVTVGDSLGDRIEALSPVSAYTSAVRLRAAAIARAMRTELDHAEVLRRLRTSLPDGARLDTVSMALPVPTGDPEERARGVETQCPGPDPFGTRVVVACVQVAGAAASRVDVATLVQRLAADGLFVEPFVTTTTTSRGTEVLFAGSVGVSPEAFTRRYDETAAAVTPAAAQEAR